MRNRTTRRAMLRHGQRYDTGTVYGNQRTFKGETVNVYRRAVVTQAQTGAHVRLLEKVATFGPMPEVRLSTVPWVLEAAFYVGAHRINGRRFMPRLYAVTAAQAWATDGTIPSGSTIEWR